jgi:carboxypeptidase PM20D1
MLSGEVDVDADSIAQRLAESLSFATISHRDEAKVERAPFMALRAWAAQRYPLLHDPALVERHDVGEGQLFILRGSEPLEAPLLLLAHTDVVPVEGASREAWTHAPFGGVIADGYVWGRGALDDKASAISIYEALEALLRAGIQPRRTLIAAIGEDEEVRGLRGAVRLAALLEELELQPFMILDEGMALLDGVFEDVEPEVGLIGVTERGYATLELLAEAEGGHSSMPPERSAVFSLARALARLEEQPMEAHIDGVVGGLLDRLRFEQPPLQRLVTSNPWLFGSLIISSMESKPGPNAMLRTTFAPTIVRAGEVENSLPTQARAWVNARVHPSDSVAGVLAYVQGLVSDLKITVSLREGASDAPAVSPSSGEAWELICRAMKVIEPSCVQAPSLVVGATDARHYARLSRNVYRFVPMRLKAEDLPRIHGVDERIKVESLGELVRFYLELALSA